jgi:hypothetical protein
MLPRLSACEDSEKIWTRCWYYEVHLKPTHAIVSTKDRQKYFPPEAAGSRRRDESWTAITCAIDGTKLMQQSIWYWECTANTLPTKVTKCLAQKQKSVSGNFETIPLQMAPLITSKVCPDRPPLICRKKGGSALCVYRSDWFTHPSPD